MELKRPLLAAKTTDEDLKRLTFPILLSPKIDGIRALVNNGRLLTRTMKSVPNTFTQEKFSVPSLHGLDGELVVGLPNDPNLMQQTTSGVMSHGGKPDVWYYVFDKWDCADGFINRTKKACEQVVEANISNIIYLSHHLVHDAEELEYWEAVYLRKGFEGIMLRSRYGPYKQGRSTLREGTLLKVKRFLDGEATILSVDPLYRNLNPGQLDERGFTKRSSHSENKIADDLLGAFQVKDCATGVSFSIGSGLTEAQRVEYWRNRSSLVGKIIKYKYQPIGVKDKPRIPIFLGFRSPLDM